MTPNKAVTDEQCCKSITLGSIAFGTLTENDLAWLEDIAQLRQFKAGELIVPEGEPSAFFAIIASGVVKLTKLLEDGRQQIVGLLFPSDLLGRIDGVQCPYAAEAATRVNLLCFEHSALRHTVCEHPEIEHRLLSHALNERDVAREWMVVLGRKTAREKVACFLDMLAKRPNGVRNSHSNMAGTFEFLLPLKRADIADYLGLTLETVSRQISALRNEGIIQLVDHRKIVVNDRVALTDAANQSCTLYLTLEAESPSHLSQSISLIVQPSSSNSTLHPCIS